jgi:hypothetical protein
MKVSLTYLRGLEVKQLDVEDLPDLKFYLLLIKPNKPIMKRAVLVVVMMLFMSVGLNAQHDPNWVGEWKITPMETEIGWLDVEDL